MSTSAFLQMILANQPPKKRNRPKSKLLQDTEGMDGCVRAKKIALRKIEARGLTRTMDDLVSVKTKKKRDKKFSKKNKILEEDKDSEFDDRGDESEIERSILQTSTVTLEGWWALLQRIRRRRRSPNHSEENKIKCFAAGAPSSSACFSITTTLENFKNQMGKPEHRDLIILA
ncbi:hypothetical protein NE237_016690 [Protea cynaroides]|uniref:Uncharacterized protein n=1 Tax=Protea cynaroides TaxID=273540 RepID=A0A9Q0HGH4_9MAGN|nr:hypothetical protein NE237_016690 [Protea cynaroides]